MSGVEVLPAFTKPARQFWELIPADVRQRLLANVWCGQCRHEVTITNFSGATKGRDLLLVGKCAECLGDVAPGLALRHRVIASQTSTKGLRRKLVPNTTRGNVPSLLAGISCAQVDEGILASCRRPSPSFTQLFPRLNAGGAMLPHFNWPGGL